MIIKISILILFIIFILLYLTRHKSRYVNKEVEFEDFMKLVRQQPEYVHPYVLQEKTIWLKNEINRLKELSRKKELKIESAKYNYKLYSSGPFNGPQDHLMEKAIKLEKLYELHLKKIKHYEKCYSTLRSFKIR